MIEIRFDKITFLQFNKNDSLGLFDKEVKRIANALEKIDPSCTYLFDYDEYVNKLCIQLFVKYNYLVLNNENSLFGIIDEKSYLIRANLNGWFDLAISFLEKKI